MLVTAWTGIAALFVSLLSIVLTCLSLWIQRTHNRKSVLPIGHITVGDYEDDIFVRLCNDRVGPLIIEEIIVCIDDNEASSKNSIIEFMPDLPSGYIWTTFVRETKGRALSAQDRLTLIELKGEPSNPDFTAAREIVRRRLSRLSVTVIYLNAYNDRMPPLFENWTGLLAQNNLVSTTRLNTVRYLELGSQRDLPKTPSSQIEELQRSYIVVLAFQLPLQRRLHLQRNVLSRAA
jgi:hypothetical protein